MSSHPDHAALFESARAPRPTPEVSAHLDGCAACREKFRRFRAGSALISEASAVTPEVDWSRMDAALHAEAQSAARSIRVGAPRRNLWSFLSVSGLTLGLAAGAVLWVRARPNTDMPGAAQPVATAPTPSAPESLAPRRPSVSRVTATRGEVSTHADALGDGAVLTTGPDGSATVALSGSWQMELGARSEVEFDHVDDPSAVTLQRGVLSVRPSSDTHHDLSLHARHWTLSSDGALVAHAELNRVRVTILSGRVSARSGAVTATYAGPVELALPDSGDRAEVLVHANTPSVASGSPRVGAPAIVAVAATAETARVPLNVIPSEAREADDIEQRYVRAQARTALSSCIRTCREQETCTGAVSLSVLVSPTGRVTHSRASGELSNEVRTCFEREARTIAITAPSSAFRFEFTVDE